MAQTGLRLTNHSDDELVRMALSGENTDAAYFTLYARYHRAVCAQISKYIKESEEIEDVCMESFEKAFAKLDTFKTGSKFATWIFRIARNTAFDHKGKEKVNGQKIEKTTIDPNNVESVDMPAEQLSPEENIISTQDHENFLGCIDNLPPHYMDIAKMCFLDNLGYNEIAQKTGIPINTVKTRISRAKTLIVRMMLDIENEDAQ